jgi:hypothetical protein
MSLLSVEQEPETRLRVYERALELWEDYYKNGQYFPYGPEGENLGLCLLLPCILWDLPHYLSKAPSGEHWDYHKTEIAFPELAKYLELILYETGNKKIETRLECLNRMIEDVKLEIEGKYVSS